MAEEKQRILPRAIEEEMKASYLDYAMSVLVGRALPDVRDGLKPVHRRILYAMRELGLLHSKPFRKSARIVGDTLGKYHPHGDMAVYDALVRMAQDFSLRYPLVQGQGNFGSIDGDNAAAMRYTESRFSKIAEEMMEDIDKETVHFAPNFDASLQEPLVLPSKFPNLLVNGSSGIAVGMATNVPPHNLREVTDAIMLQIDNPDVDMAMLMSAIKGPDFPTGGSILGTAGIRAAYFSGRGAVRVRGKASFEEHSGHERIIITEIPFQLNKSLLIEEIAVLVREKKIPGIADLRDESDRDGMRIVIELRRDANRDVVLNQLFSHSRLESTFGIMMVALVDGQPRTISLKDLIGHFISHRRDVVKRRTRFELDRATERAHMLEGLIIALDNVDAVIRHIRAAADIAAAKQALMGSFPLSEQQAAAILDMRLQKLASLEQQKIRDEHQQLLMRIADLKGILASEQKVRDIIKQETAELREKYGDDRRTEIVEMDGDVITDEDLIAPDEMVVTLTRLGYVKRISLAEYRQQRRGGRGVTATDMREGDFVERLFVANTHDTILFFTSRGIVHWLKVYQLPEGSRYSRGKALVNLLNLWEGERVTACLPVHEFRADVNLVMATRSGTIKKTGLSAYAKPRRGGIIAITLGENDVLINVAMTTGIEQIILASRSGLAVRFREQDIRATGRSAKGVRGMRLRSGDEVVGMEVVDEKKTLLSVTENGYGKRTPAADYRLTSRGGIGVISIQTSERNGSVVSVLSVEDNDELMFVSRSGIMIRVPARDISSMGRNTQGVRVMRLAEGDRLVASARVIPENAGTEPSP